MDSRLGDQQSGSEQACLLVYDGDCRLCVGTKHKLEQAGLGPAGSNVRFLPYQSEEAKQVLGARYIPGRPAAAFLVRPTGEVREGLDAFLPLLPSLPGGQVLLWLLRFPLMEKATTWGYQVIARHRYRLFGKARPSHTQH
jgi:predicted DCC family thiol-disulfide oxidoreductase YuxK